MHQTTSKSGIERRARRKVHRRFARRRHKYVAHPTIRIGGIYLKALGFDIGDEIEVSCTQGRIVIVKVAPAAKKPGT